MNPEQEADPEEAIIIIVHEENEPQEPGVIDPHEQEERSGWPAEVPEEEAHEYAPEDDFPLPDPNEPVRIPRQ